MRCLGLLLVLSLPLPVWAQSDEPPPVDVGEIIHPPIPDSSRQMIVVTTRSWQATTGLLHRFERTPEGWSPVGEAVRVNVGRSGLAWGRGLHRTVRRWAEPYKEEGDGAAPAGVFLLTGAFGYAESLATGLPYHASQPSSVCVDDTTSAYYNRVFDPEATAVRPDWTSRETMRRRDSLYAMGVTVAHNGPTADASWAEAVGPAPVPGGGSCIFLHVERGPGVPTAGCTSMPAPALAEVLAWLDADAHPVLVQLPGIVYRAWRSRWRLP